MFETADIILRRQGLMAYAGHAISWKWDGFQPKLVIFDFKKNGIEEGAPAEFHPGDRLDLTVSEARRCIGSFNESGHQPCPMRREVKGQHDQCPQCASSWIPVQNCIFEPACDGVNTDCPGGKICAREHHVYAAFYGDMIKVGMTLSSRFMERAIEQGADAIAQLGTYPNRLEARKAENVLSKALKATQWVRRNAFLKAQGRKIDRDAYQEMLDRALSSVNGDLIRPTKVRSLTDYPLPSLDLSRARFDTLPGRHRGEVLGCKGKFLVYRNKGGEVLLLSMSSLPSRLVTLDQGNHNKVQGYASTPPVNGA